MLYFFIAVFIAALFVLLIAWLTEWGCSKLGVKIKFKSFKTFYNINRDRWTLHDGYVQCRIDNDSYVKYGRLFSTDQSFYFDPIDFLKYKLWIHSKHKCDQQLENAEITAKMLAMVKQDIETIEIRAKQYQAQGIDDMQRILSHINMKGPKG